MLTHGEEVAYSRPHTEQKVDRLTMLTLAQRYTLISYLPQCGPCRLVQTIPELPSTVWDIHAGSNDPRVTYHRVGYAVSVWFEQSQSCSDLCVHILPGGLG